VIIRVEDDVIPPASGVPVNSMLIPDTVAITSISCTNGTLTVRAETNKLNPAAVLTISIEGVNGPLSGYAPEDLNVMAPNGSAGKFIEVVNLGGLGTNCAALNGKVVTVSSDGGMGASPTDDVPPDEWGSGGSYNKKVGS